MVKKENYIKLYANCIPVKGKKRSAICDLQRNNIRLIPNDLCNLLQDSISNIEVIKANYNNEFDETIDEYFEFLIDNEFAFKTNTPELFPKMSLDWFEPAIINNAIIDISKESKFDIYRVVQQLDDFNCKNVQIRFYRETTIKEIKSIINYLDTNEMFITSVDFIVPILKINNIIEVYQDIIQRHKRINSIVNYGATKKEFIEPINEFGRGYIAFVKENIISQINCGKIESTFFTPNIKTFTESQKYNSCLNKKIAIDTNGNIKNCPSMLQSFGNIKDTTLQEALNHKDFKKHWNLTKDSIDVCKDCEFRYICTDCRAYIEKPNDIYSKPLKCGYNPYTNEWSEWSTNPLKQKAIEYYGMQELVKKDDEV